LKLNFHNSGNIFEKHYMWREEILVFICIDTIWTEYKVCVAARLLLGLMKDAGVGLYLPNVND